VHHTGQLCPLQQHQSSHHLPLQRLGGGPVTATTSSKFQPSSPSLPCPTCGRDDKGGDCRISAGLVLCHHGSTFSPPALAVGATTLGNDGQTWAYTGEASDGRCAVFALDKPKPGARRTITTSRAPSKPAQPIKLALLPEGAETARAYEVTASGCFFPYSPNQRIQRARQGEEKKDYCHYYDPNKNYWDKVKGPNPWPFYNEAACQQYGPTNWVLETEGEKCCDVASSLGIVACSHPGPVQGKGTKPPRYARLQGSGVAGIVYLADNDETGKKKALSCAEAAKEARIPFVALDAAEVWPGIPAKGSIDDLPEPLDWAETIATIEKAANAALAKAREEIAESPSSTKEDEDHTTAKAIGALLEKLLDATLAEDQPLVDALKSRAWGYQLTREVLQERLLSLWAKRKGLLSGGKTPARTRTIGQADAGPGLQQLQPGFMLANDLHVLAADGGVGKTFLTLELATIISIGNTGFLDQEAGRTGKKKKVLYIATDGESSAWAILNNYADQLCSFERGADLDVWAEDAEAGEAAWNVSLPNLERLAQRMAQGDLAAVVIDTANACFQKAGISPYTGPVDQYLRLLKAIVCPHAALWINCHTTRSGQGMKAVGGHPAWQEVPSAVHRIERLKKEEGEAHVYKWTVEKFRGESPRSFSYQRVDGEFRIVEGTFHENVGDLLLKTIDDRQKAGLPTKPSALVEATKKSPASVWMALTRLRQQRLVRSQGTGNRLTALGQDRLLMIAPPADELEDLESMF